MSLKRNIFASYANQIYITSVGIFALPMYLKYMGAEAYGLVGFFTMMQAWFNLLDLGLTPTVARETARFRGGVITILEYRRLLRAVQIIFLFIAIVGGGILFLSSGVIANSWLNVQNLKIEQVRMALQLMALGIAFRWSSGFCRGYLSGSEEIIWLSGLNTLIATFKFIGVIPILVLYDNSIIVFFSYQLIVSIVEFLLLVFKSYGLYPVLQKNQKIGWSANNLFFSIKNSLRFSMTIAFTSFVWILVTQIDKLILSKILSLENYGIFTLAVLGASGVTMIAGPISTALMPRMAKLQAERKDDALVLIYRNSTQFVAMVAIPACLILAVFSEEILWAWTGDLQASRNASLAFCFYALGNGFLAMSAFPYYLQFAKGDLKMHMIGNIIFLIIFVPLLIYLTLMLSTVGAGIAWLISNVFYFFGWVPVVHRRFYSNFHNKWLFQDILPIATLSIMVVFFAYYFHVKLESRVEVIFYALGLGIAIVLLNFVVLSRVRKLVFVNL